MMVSTDTRDKYVLRLHAAGIEPAAISRRLAMQLNEVYYVILCDVVHRMDIEDAQKRKEVKKNENQVRNCQD